MIWLANEACSCCEDPGVASAERLPQGRVLGAVGGAPLPPSCCIEAWGVCASAAMSQGSRLDGSGGCPQ